MGTERGAGGFVPRCVMKETKGMEVPEGKELRLERSFQTKVITAQCFPDKPCLQQAPSLSKLADFSLCCHF